jgi:hypothetical protein
LYSSAATLPYEIAGCDCTVTFDDGSSQSFDDWTAEAVGTPQPSGADFTVEVADASYSSGSYETNIANWALTFIPRGTATSAQSPFGNNQSTISGSGATNSDGVFTLDTSNAKIKNTGDWDYALMVQMTLPDGSIECFASDPEMEVGS